MKNKTLEELIEDTFPLYELPEGMVRIFGVDREGIKYVAMAVDKEAFIKKVYEAGGEAGYERLRKYVAICPQCNDFCDLIPLDGRGNYVYECFGCQKTYKLEDVNK